MTEATPKTPAAPPARPLAPPAPGVAAPTESTLKADPLDGVVQEAGSPTTAGGLLRAARQARGLHIAALAASIKVTQRKLESLEADRYAELPDMTFTRALAKAICRSLKVDPEPVLALLPQLGGGLDKVHQGLNTTFRDRPGRLEPTDFTVLARPAVWVPLLLVLAAVAIYLLPQSWIADLRPMQGAASAATAASVPASAASVATALPAAAVAETAPVPVPEALPGPASAPTELNATIELRTSGDSWVEVLDGHGATLLQRMLQSGEAVGLDGTPPFKVKIGNALRTQLRLRGQPVDLAPSTRDNVARLELK